MGWDKTWTQPLRAEVGLLFLSVPRRGGPCSSQEEGTAGRPVAACRQPLAAIFSEPTSSPLPGLASMHMTLKKQLPGGPENGAQLQTPDCTGCGSRGRVVGSSGAGSVGVERTILFSPLV